MVFDRHCFLHAQSLCCVDKRRGGAGGILSMPDPTLRRCSSWVVYLMMILIIISVVLNSISLFAVSTRGGSCQRLTPPQRRCSSWVVCPMMIQIVSAVRTLSLAQMITRKRRKDQNLRWSMKVKFLLLPSWSKCVVFYDLLSFVEVKQAFYW